MTYKRIFTILFTGLISICSLIAQEVQRPAVWGIAKMTFLVSDMEMAREYYGRFLGFDEAFSYPSPSGTVVSFKINDRQFLEFIVDKQAKEKKRLVSISLETESVPDMLHYLKAQGVKVSPCITDGAGNEVIVTQDAAGNNVEFINLKADGLHRKSKGKFLSENQNIQKDTPCRLIRRKDRRTGSFLGKDTEMQRNRQISTGQNPTRHYPIPRSRRLYREYRTLFTL